MKSAAFLLRIVEAEKQNDFSSYAVDSRWRGDWHISELVACVHSDCAGPNSMNINASEVLLRFSVEKAHLVGIVIKDFLVPTDFSLCSRAGKAITLMVAFAGIGLSTVWLETPQVVLLFGIYAAVIWIGIRGRDFPGDLLVVLIAGNVILNFGFANLGFHVGGLPLPLTEVLLLPLAGFAMLRLSSLKELGWPGLLLLGLLIVTTARFIVSYPQWGTLAVRDYTSPLEASCAFIIGFWAIREYGLVKWTRIWLTVFVALLFYVTLFPYRELLASSGPQVGLQRPVPLLGQYMAVGPAAGAAFFFFHLRLSGFQPHLLGGWALLLMAIIQERSLYLVIPLAALVLIIVSDGRGRVIVGRLTAGLVVAIVALFLLAPFIPSGRVGSLTPAFFISHAATIFGADGPGSGTIDDRSEWRHDILNRITSQSSSLILGLGPGPDLLNGFVGLDGQLIRKPHNDYLEMFARYGILGLSLWVGFIVSVLCRIWFVVRQNVLPDDEQTFLLWALTLATIYLVVSAVQPLMSFPYGTIPLFTVLGMGLAVAGVVPRGFPEEFKKASLHISES